MCPMPRCVGGVLPTCEPCRASACLVHGHGVVNGHSSGVCASMEEAERASLSQSEGQSILAERSSSSRVSQARSALFGGEGNRVMAQIMVGYLPPGVS